MIIEAKGIHKSFGTLEVLKGVDFSAEKGEVVSIMGASGAGKSTLLQILGTLSRPDAGTLEIDGTEVASLRDSALSAFRGRRIGFVFQAHRLLPEFSALENVMMPALIAGESAASAREKAHRAATSLPNSRAVKLRELPLPAPLSTTPQYSSQMNRPVTSTAQPKPISTVCSSNLGSASARP